MTRNILLMLFVALPTVACAKASYKTAPPADYAYDEAANDMTYDSAAYGPEADYEPAAAPDADAPPARESKRRGLFRHKSRGDLASPATAGSSAPGGDATSTAVEPAEPAIAEERPADVGRHIIYMASMQISVFNLDDAMTVAEALPDKFGGYIASMNHGTLVLRIPSKNLRALMEEVGDLGVIEHRSLQAQDVTDEYFDIESRITALEKTHAQMLELLSKARTVQEALEVRRALDQIAMELEVLKGRMRKLDNLISFSTLTLSLIERGPHTPTPSSNDPFRWVDSLGVEATEWK